MKADNFPKWFEDNNTRGDFESMLKEYKGKKNLRFLQIGIFTGNASRWLFENILIDSSSVLVDVDPWCGNVQHEVYDWAEIASAYKEQLSPYSSRLKTYTMFSKEFFEQGKEKDFDFIYIDGDHSPEAVAIDAAGAWNILKTGGIISFDDYEWNHPAGIEFNPKPAIDKWLTEHKDDIEILRVGWQVWIRKK